MVTLIRKCHQSLNPQSGEIFILAELYSHKDIKLQELTLSGKCQEVTIIGHHSITELTAHLHHVFLLLCSESSFISHATAAFEQNG